MGENYDGAKTTKKKKIYNRQEIPTERKLNGRMDKNEIKSK